MTAFSVKFVNKTQTVWTMVVTITLPGGNDLQSVAFKQVRAAGNNGSGTVRFDDQLCVCLGAHTGTGSSRVYETTLTNPAIAGSAWKVVSADGVQQFVANGSAHFPDQIEVLNSSKAWADIGIGLTLTAAAFRPDVPDGGYVPFTLPPSFWVVLSSEVVAPGQVMGVSPAAMFSTAVLTPQVQLSLSAATPNATVTASVTGSELLLDVTYP